MDDGGGWTKVRCEGCGDTIEATLDETAECSCGNARIYRGGDAGNSFAAITVSGSYPTIQLRCPDCGVAVAVSTGADVAALSCPACGVEGQLVGEPDA